MKIIGTLVDPANLVADKSYLVMSKHGLIEGCWKPDEFCFTGYYWRDLCFIGQAYELTYEDDTFCI